MCPCLYLCLCVQHVSPHNQNVIHTKAKLKDIDPLCNRPSRAFLRKKKIFPLSPFWLLFSQIQPPLCLQTSLFLRHRCPSTRPHLIIFPSPSSRAAFTPTPPPCQSNTHYNNSFPDEHRSLTSHPFSQTHCAGIPLIWNGNLCLTFSSSVGSSEMFTQNRRQRSGWWAWCTQHSTPAPEAWLFVLFHNSSQSLVG